MWELSVLLKNTTQFLQLGFEPRPRNLELSALTMMPPHLHKDQKDCSYKIVLDSNWSLKILVSVDFKMEITVKFWQAP